MSRVNRTENPSCATQGIKEHTPLEKTLFSLQFSQLSTSLMALPLPLRSSVAPSPQVHGSGDARRD